ncbi:MAG: TraR/DksA family transcriptional regulator [Candidatus Sumerlaeia bacterium]|nr:TraR/DksA family transcriptional regulator [Candidatus Sumerlaeia bacterium]
MPGLRCVDRRPAHEEDLMLTPKERKTVKAAIEAAIVEAEAMIEDLRTRAAPVSPDSAIGRLSRMDSMVNAGTARMALDQAEKKLSRLHARLDRIDDANFDVCGVCAGQLPMARLLAAPDRGVCVACLQQKH